MTKLARDVMTPDPACCSPNATLEEAARLMVENDCGEIPVVDTSDRPIGVITIATSCAERSPKARTPPHTPCKA